VALETVVDPVIFLKIERGSLYSAARGSVGFRNAGIGVNMEVSDQGEEKQNDDEQPGEAFATQRRQRRFDSKILGHMFSAEVPEKIT